MKGRIVRQGMGRRKEVRPPAVKGFIGTGGFSDLNSGFTRGMRTGNTPVSISETKVRCPTLERTERGKV